MILVLHAPNSLFQSRRNQYANNDDDWAVLLQGKRTYSPITIVHIKKNGWNGKQSWVIWWILFSRPYSFQFCHILEHSRSFRNWKNGDVKRLHFNFQRTLFFLHYSIIFICFIWCSKCKKSVFNDGEKSGCHTSLSQSVSQFGFRCLNVSYSLSAGIVGIPHLPLNV